MKTISLLVLASCFVLMNNEVFCQPQSITDFDGIDYEIITIGNQTWMKTNLRSKTYADGTPIPQYYKYENNDSLSLIYGYLYSWDVAIRNSETEGAQGVCPNGWHIPSDIDWEELENELGGNDVAGGAMKESGTSHWVSPNLGATNSSQFTALPAGCYQNGTYNWLLNHTYFWTSNKSGTSNARSRELTAFDEYLTTVTQNRTFANSIRCIKDTVLPSGMVKNSPSEKPFSIVTDFENRQITVYQKGQEFENALVEIFTIDGRKVQSLNLTQSPETFKVYGDVHGYYVVKINTCKKCWAYQIIL